MYSENCDDCGLNGITDTVKTLFSTGTEIVSDVAKDLPALYQQKRNRKLKKPLCKSNILTTWQKSGPKPKPEEKNLKHWKPGKPPQQHRQQG